MNTDRRIPYSFCSDPPAYKTQLSACKPDLLTLLSSDSATSLRTTLPSSFPPLRSHENTLSPQDWRERFAEACRDLRLSQPPIDAPVTLFDRFTARYKILRELPRRERRSLQRQWKHSLAGVALLFALGAQSAPAAIINVGGQCTLARAIVSANNDASPRGFCTSGSGADQVVLPGNSTVTLTTINNTNFGPTGLPIIRSVMTIDANGSIIKRVNGAPKFRIFAVAESADLQLQDATVRGGVAVGDFGYGGGLLNFGALTLANTTVAGNKAATGGGVFNYDTSGEFNVLNSTISGNQAVGTGTGRAGDGGGVYHARYAGLFTVTNSVISGNQASGSGGGVYTGENTTLNLTDSNISGNRAGADGGGVFNNNDSASVRVTSSTLSGNQAGGDGGAIYVGYSSGIDLTNSTISGNKAAGAGGGIRAGDYVGVSLRHTTVTRNSAASGGGVFNDDNGGVQVIRSLISGNNAANGREIFNQPRGQFIAANFNLLGHSGLTSAQAFANFTPGSTDITATSDGNSPSALSAILNRSLTSNGGATRTHALVTDSPAIDAINDGTCPPPATDQRGVSRPRDGDGDGGVACDIGAFEVASAPPPVPSAKCQGVVATLVGTAGDDYLVGTAGRDVIQGLGGEDRLVALEGDDLICGGKDRDNIYGGPGNDRIYGERGDDRLLGVGGADQIFGGSERDTMDGGAGSDRCDGGPPSSGDSAVNCERRVNIP